MTMTKMNNDNYAKLTLMPLTAEKLALATGGEIHRINGGFGGEVTNVTTDSRTLPENGMFVAISGENFDGHNYIADVIKKGVRLILAERIPVIGDEAPGADIVIVENTVRALGKLASFYIDESRVKKIAVTGSVGKTTTKEMINSVLSYKYRTHKTEGNKNNEIGLPLTALSIPPETEYAIFECGMSGLGEIEYLSEIVKPEIGIITNIGSSHMEKLGSRENIAKAKLEIISGMNDGALLMINGDEPLLFESPQVKNRKKVITAALRNRNADYRAVNMRATADGTVFDLIYQGKVAANVEVPLLGTHNVYNALYAFAVGIESGMSVEAIRLGLMAYKGVSMRQRIFDIGGFTIIEDCYNASPESMRAGIDVLVMLAKNRGGRAAALLGDMKELGEHTLLMHEQLGIYAAKAGVKLLYTYGPLSENIARSAISNGVRAENVYVNLNSNDSAVTGEMILGSIKPGDVLLVKASRSVAAEAVIKYIENKLEKEEQH